MAASFVWSVSSVIRKKPLSLAWSMACRSSREPSPRPRRSGRTTTSSSQQAGPPSAVLTVNSRLAMPATSAPSRAAKIVPRAGDPGAAAVPAPAWPGRAGTRLPGRRGRPAGPRGLGVFHRGGFDHFHAAGPRRLEIGCLLDRDRPLIAFASLPGRRRNQGNPEAVAVHPERRLAPVAVRRPAVLAAPSQPPPRITRSEPSEGPGGSRRGLLP